jgi:hypothetical protein
MARDDIDKAWRPRRRDRIDNDDLFPRIRARTRSLPGVSSFRPKRFHGTHDRDDRSLEAT